MENINFYLLIFYFEKNKNVSLLFLKLYILKNIQFLAKNIIIFDANYILILLIKFCYFYRVLLSFEKHLRNQKVHQRYVKLLFQHQVQRLLVINLIEKRNLEILFKLFLL